MELSLENLLEIIREAFDAGLTGTPDLRPQIEEELLARFKVKIKANIKVWTVEKLREMPVGSIFDHSLKGRCSIAEHSNGAKFMQFQSGKAIEFTSNSDPWDKPMRLLESS